MAQLCKRFIHFRTVIRRNCVCSVNSRETLMQIECEFLSYIFTILIRVYIIYFCRKRMLDFSAIHISTWIVLTHEQFFSVCRTNVSQMWLLHIRSVLFSGLNCKILKRVWHWNGGHLKSSHWKMSPQNSSVAYQITYWPEMLFFLHMK